MTVTFNIDQHVICTWLHLQPQLTFSFPDFSSILTPIFNKTYNECPWITCIPPPIDEQLSIQDHLFFFLIISSFTLTQFILFSYLLIKSYFCNLKFKVENCQLITATNYFVCWGRGKLEIEDGKGVNFIYPNFVFLNCFVH